MGQAPCQLIEQPSLSQALVPHRDVPMKTNAQPRLSDVHPAEEAETERELHRRRQRLAVAALLGIRRQLDPAGEPPRG
ncbi:MAG: hypothetical protein EA398_03625 [Deltaproteobacteria bacterium]|nr:MAG: hypothetical protein EA398_03625 [Deltaproteobacteria bacterium]